MGDRGALRTVLTTVSFRMCNVRIRLVNNGTLRFVLMASGSYYSPLHDRKRGDSKNEQQHNTNNANDQTSVSP